MLETKTPSNIEDMSLNDVVQLLNNDVQNDCVPPPLNRMKIIRMVYQILGYNLSSDLALALCAEPTAKLVIAPAGGGKTTSSQINAICEKIWRKSTRYSNRNIRGDKILCLVYNKHNVKPMIDKHRMLVNRLKVANIKGLDIDDEINAATMHSFCDQIRKENVAKLGLMGFHLLNDVEAAHLMKNVKDRVLAKYNLRNNPSEHDILSLYTYAKESMLTVSALQETDKFLDINLDVDKLTEIFELYEKMKMLKRKYDFTDMLTKIYELFLRDPIVLQATQRYYEYIIADEIQDFTPIMMNILQLMVNNGTPLMCIGDEDQGIYNFRGADIYNTLNFTDKFEDSAVYSLTKNRRCAKKILDYAKSVISDNKLRYQKVITGVKAGGEISLQPYNTLEGEHLKLMSFLEKLDEKDIMDSVICYRERSSSIMITELLAEKKIPFYVISGYSAYSHILYKDLIGVLDALEAPFDKNLSLALYKVLPIKRDKLFNIFKYDDVNHRFKDDTKQHFANYDYGDAMSVNGFASTMEVLKDLSLKLRTETMDNIFPTVFNLLSKYHWKRIKYDRAGQKLGEYDNFIEMRVDKVFNQHKTYKQVSEELNKKIEFCRRNEQTRSGIAISTFHGLKGLEFTNCYLLDLDNGIFPNNALIDSKPYTEDTKDALKECNTRLYYVAITRAKENLYLFYNEDNPTKYVLPLLGRNKTQSILEEVQVKTVAPEPVILNNLQVFDTTEKISIEPQISYTVNVPSSSSLDDLLFEETMLFSDELATSNIEDSDLTDLLFEENSLFSDTFTENSVDTTGINSIDVETVTNKVLSPNSSYLTNLLGSLGG